MGESGCIDLLQAMELEEWEDVDKEEVIVEEVKNGEEEMLELPNEWILGMGKPD